MDAAARGDRAGPLRRPVRHPLGGDAARARPGARRTLRADRALPGLGVELGAVTAIASTPDGALWIGTADRGLVRLGRGGGRGSTRSARGCRTTASGPWPSDRAVSSGWARSAGSAVSRREPGRPSTDRDGLPSRNDQCPADGSRRQSLGGHASRALPLSRRCLREALAARQAVPRRECCRSSRMPKGAIWVGTDTSGLRRLRDVDFTTVTLGGELTDVWSVYRDRQGALWFGTDDRGLIRSQSGRITSFTTAQGLPSDHVRPVLQDRRGDLWVGTGAGLCRLRPGSGKDQVRDLDRAGRAAGSLTSGSSTKTATGRSGSAPARGWRAGPAGASRSWSRRRACRANASTPCCATPAAPSGSPPRSGSFARLETVSSVSPGLP